MIFLPIVERELRVAARRPLTYWIRPLAAAITLIVLSSFLFRDRRMFGPAGGAGAFAFNFIAGLALMYCLAAGVLGTSDCLSGEKREGTLGLLFLTELTGHDVVLGKLAATSLNTLYGLLAILPVLGITLLMGGVTGGEFGRVALVLLNALVFSLALGLWVSACSHEAYRASVTTLLLLVALTGGPFLLDLFLTLGKPGTVETPILLVSPAYSFSKALATGYKQSPGSFWLSFVVVQLLAWFCLRRAGTQVLRHCHDAPALAPVRPSRSSRHLAAWLRPRPRPFLQERWREANPAVWLAAHFQGRDWPIWLPAFLALGVLVWQTALGLAVNQPLPPLMALVSMLTLLTTLFFYLMMTARASRCFLETHAAGILDLLCCTPLPPENLVRGQRIALRPLLVRLIIVGGLVQVCSTIHQLTVFATTPNVRSFYLVNLTWGLVVFALDLVALSWMAMWLALKARNLNQVVMRSLLFVIVLPYLALLLLQFNRVVVFAGQVNLIGLSMVPFLMAGKDVLFVRYARGKLHREFRRRLSEGR